MLNRLPKYTPSLNDMLRELGEPNAAELAKALNLSERTVKGWIKTNQAPRCGLLAIFWLTSYGRAALDQESHSREMLSWQSFQAQKRENKQLKLQIENLMKLGDFGCANDPVPFSVALRARALVLRTETSFEFSPIRVTIPNAPHTIAKR